MVHCPQYTVYDLSRPIARYTLYYIQYGSQAGSYLGIVSTMLVHNGTCVFTSLTILVEQIFFLIVSFTVVVIFK